MKYKYLIILFVVVILATVGAYLLIKKPACVFTSNMAITTFDECAEAGNAVMESYPRQCRTSDGKHFIEDIGGVLDKMNLIKVDSLFPNEVINSPLEVSGEARGFWFFEGDFPIKILDSEGELLGVTIAQAQTDWMTEEFVQFKAILIFDDPETKNGNVLFIKDNPSDIAEQNDELRIPVKFGTIEEKISIKVYFNNNELDPDISCNKVFSVNREIVKVPGIAKATLGELLKGTTQTEKDNNYFTNINSGVEINSLSIVDGIAKVDFNGQLDYQVGGSCRVGAIRAQITETLKQFTTVNEVIISINGRIEDILQP
ncbi:MAG: GerMN domain-containing protein [Candidatus Nealsonbacteria bacterium]